MEILIPNNAWHTAVSQEKGASPIVCIGNLFICLPRSVLMLKPIENKIKTEEKGETLLTENQEGLEVAPYTHSE